MKKDTGEQILEILTTIFSTIGTILFFVANLIWKLISAIFSSIFHLIADILSGVRGRIVQAGSAFVFIVLVAYVFHFFVR